MPSEKINFTKAALEALPIPDAGKRAYYYDSKVRGLAVSITPTGAKTFLVYRWIDGQPERITLGRFPDLTVHIARTKAEEINGLIAENINPNDKKRAARIEMTFGELFQQYLDRHAKVHKKTWREDIGKFNNLIAKKQPVFISHADRLDPAHRSETLAPAEIGSLARKKLTSVTRFDIANLFSTISKDHPVTANRTLSLISSVFGRASEWGLWIGDNPAQGIRRHRETSRDRFLQADELPRFFESLEQENSDNVRDYILVSLLTGARRSNVLSMRWSDISLDRKEWRISDPKNTTDKPTVAQRIPLTTDIMAILVRRKKASHSDYVFPGPGKTGHLIEPKRVWNRILARANLADVRIHDLRRTLGSWQAATGANMSVIGKTLNHKSTSTTAVYARLDIDPVRAAMEKAGKAMLESGRPKTERKKVGHAKG